jgi:hypothetical protein
MDLTNNHHHEDFCEVMHPKGNSVDPENVVQIVTNNVVNYVAARKLLEKEFPNLYWSPYVSHCINLMLQNMVKLEEVREAMPHVSKVTKYICDHCFALYLMRQSRGGHQSVMGGFGSKMPNPIQSVGEKSRPNFTQLN